MLYLTLNNSGANVEFPKDYPTSCLLGCVEMTDCMAQDDYRQKVVTWYLNHSVIFLF